MLRVADPALQSLLQENEELQKENSMLREENAEYGLAVGPLSPKEGRSAIEAKLQALRREHEALLGLQKLGEHLQGLQKVNGNLHQEAQHLQKENVALRGENVKLRATTKSSMTAGARLVPVATSKTAGSDAFTPSSAAGFNSSPTHMFAAPPAPARDKDRGRTRAASGELGPNRVSVVSAVPVDVSSINKCSEKQKKEMVAAMLQGLFDGMPDAKEGSVLGEVPAATNTPYQATLHSTPTSNPPANTNPATSTFVPSNPGNTLPVALSRQAQADTPERFHAAPPSACKTGDRSPERLKRTSFADPPVEITLIIDRNERLPSKSKADRPPSLEEEVVAPAGQDTDARDQQVSHSKPMSEQTLLRASPPLHSLQAQATPYVPTSPIELQAQEIAKGLQHGDTRALHSVDPEQRREMVAEMLKQGLFSAVPAMPAQSETEIQRLSSPPGASFGRDMAVRDMLTGLYTSKPEVHREYERSTSPRPQISDVSEMGREMAVREKLMEVFRRP